jgi:hypothetical protein
MILWGEPVGGRSFEGVLLFGFAIIICFAFSYCVIKLVDYPIENIRRKVRNRTN